MRPLDEFTKAGARDKVDLVDGLIGTNVVLCDALFNSQCFRKRLKSQSYDISPAPGSKLGIIIIIIVIILLLLYYPDFIYKFLIVSRRMT